MSFARQDDAFRARGAEVAAISVDTPAQNRAMIDKLLLPFPLLSDPQGEQAIKPYGAWDERGQIAVPTIGVVARDGEIRWWYQGQDFADRPEDRDLFAALDQIGPA